MALFNLFGKSEAEDQPLDGTILGEKWKASIAQWKERLAAVVARTSTENLDPRVVCRGDRCEMGRWISGEGKRHYGGFGEFVDLRAAHAHFHMQAGLVVDMCKCGDLTGARKKFVGDFDKASTDLSGAIDKLRAKAGR